MDKLRAEAEQVRNKLRNYIDQPNHSMAKDLVREVEDLILDIRASKNSYSIDNRLKQVIKRLEAFSDDTIMDFRHIDEIMKHSDNMRQAVQKL